MMKPCRTLASTQERAARLGCPPKAARLGSFPRVGQQDLVWQGIRAVLRRGKASLGEHHSRAECPGAWRSPGSISSERILSWEPGDMDSDPAPPPTPYWVTPGTLFIFLSIPQLLPCKVGRISLPALGNTERTHEIPKKCPLSSSLSFFIHKVRRAHHLPHRAGMRIINIQCLAQNEGQICHDLPLI